MKNANEETVQHDGITLGRILEENGIKHAVLGRKLGHHPNTITNWKKSARLSTQVLLEVSEALKMDLTPHFPRLKEIVKNNKLYPMIGDAEQVLLEVRDLSNKYERTVKQIADKDMEIKYLKENITHIKEKIESKDEIIELLKQEIARKTKSTLHNSFTKKSK